MIVYVDNPLEVTNMATSSSLQKAAQAWCTPTTSKKVMDSELAEAFAEILDEVLSKSWQGDQMPKKFV